MEKKYLLTLDDEFINYCKLNDISDIENYAKKVFNTGFNITKYGVFPNLDLKMEQDYTKNKEVKIERGIDKKNEVKKDSEPEKIIVADKKNDIYDE